MPNERQKRLLEAAHYHEQFAKGVLAPCFGRAETDRVKQWSRDVAAEHLSWAKACRDSAGVVSDERPGRFACWVARWLIRLGL